ncbi:cell wall metabolism sensor histidine kinase WalK [Halomicronema sp. CCY15110]|uniref:sensor histidine kinase n=1 Tax=Halomicronema sp. CCY15110 TaxID=2767773 RepID=UPI001EF1D2FE|nr:PAS domain-containing sensor histidine kinase [Halomicronema sp. CCY15110]
MMDTTNDWFLVAGAIASGGLGWWVRGLASQSPIAPWRTTVPPTMADSDQGGHTGNASADAHQPINSYQLLQQAPVGYLEVDEENQLIWINPLASQMLGIPAISQDSDAIAPLTPRLLLELVRSFELDQLIEQTRQAQRSCQQDWVLNLVSPDPINPNEGVAYPLRGHGVPLPHRHVGVFLENRQEAENLLQQRNRWTSDVAHELKTPLTSIRLVAETLRERVDPALLKWVDRLLNEILRLGNLVEDLLNLSRLERSGGTGLTLKPVELPRLILAAWQSLEPLAEMKQVQIAYEGPSELIVQLDEPLMHRVLINLIDNAVKYSPREGTIYVRATVACESSATVQDLTMAPQQLRVDVIDEGKGFQESDLPHIFDRFYRADMSRTRPSTDHYISLAGNDFANSGNTGSGLGLAISQQIAEAHGGKLLAQNHPETGGGWLSIVMTTQPLSLQAASVV